MSLRTQDAHLIISAAHPSQFPEVSGQEVVFVGKSNVGKSSIINALAKRKKLAYVGQRPGKTRLANFYHINEDLVFVDVPGYGFAKRSKKEQEDFGVLMDGYFGGRQIDFMFVLVDVRRGLSDDDEMMIQIAEMNNIPFLVILSKTDKLSRSKVLNYKRRLEDLHDWEVLPFSHADAQSIEKIEESLKLNLHID
ncbi:ribosome biogenesis GTP-binding protein YihA/YsxC [Erysipelothrix urinaevulpis]|uniref:ribosome biogenesis GTP-binding protein YihA/YsxC n=1 Tax=Erysipelothrix urinaevulpis TaxID=2683717 RepID=UPI00135B0CE2|nr:ribosome biogenesis GTP-binding protein YihA/YsxC [Erysipelothrix urinaevulpis]